MIRNASQKGEKHAKCQGQFSAVWDRASSRSDGFHEGVLTLVSEGVLILIRVLVFRSEVK